MNDPRRLFGSRKPPYLFVVLALAFAFQVSSLGFGRFAYTALLPGMKSDLGLTNTLAGFFQVGILSGYLLFAYLCGACVRRWGLAAVINGSVIAGGVAMAALGLVDSFALCLPLAILIGAGAAGSYIPLVPLIIGWSSTRRSGSALGFAISGSGASIIFVGWMSPLLFYRFGLSGWRHAWLILGTITVLAGLAGVFFLKENPAGLGPPPVGLARSPLRTLLAAPALRTLLTVYLLVGFGYIIYATFIVAYAIEAVGLPPKAAGMVWSSYGIAALLGCFFWGAISDRFGRKKVVTADLFLLAAAILLGILWQAPTGLYLSAILFAFALNGFITLITALFGDHLPMAQLYRIFGLSTLIHGLGQAVGVGIAGWLKDLTTTFTVPFLLAVLAIGLCPILLRTLQGPTAIQAPDQRG
jgi:MFS family permease